MHSENFYGDECDLRFAWHRFKFLFANFALLGLHTYSVIAFRFGRCVCCLLIACLYRVISQKRSELGAKFRHLYMKLGSESKNMMSDFASEVAKYPQKLATTPKIVQNSVRVYYLFLLNDAACLNFFWWIGNKNDYFFLLWYWCEKRR